MRPSPLRVIVLLFLLSTLAFPAESAPSKLDARARAAVARLRAGGQTVEAMRRAGASIDRDGALDVFIRGTVTRDRLVAAGARVRTALPGLFTASIPLSAVERVAALEDVVAIRGGAPCEPELDVSVPTTGAHRLRGAGPGFAGLNGQGVLIGVVDTGVDFGHGDFRDSTGATRILNIWDQTAVGTGLPGYPYGKEWSQAEIGAGTCTEIDDQEHGTHVAGIAAGDGSQTGGSTPAYRYAGMAPRADLIVVKTDFLTPDVLDGVSYVFDKATARGENAVVNLSLGTHYGSHDGASDFEQGVTLLCGPGRIVVKSAGNDRGTAVHGEVFATPAGASATILVSGSASDRYFGIDGYYNSTERLRLQVRTPNGTTIGPLVLNRENASWPGQSMTNGTVYVAHDSVTGGRRNVYLEVYADGNHNMNGTWTITLFADQLGAANGQVDMWRHLLSPGLTANFVSGNQPTRELVTEPGNAASVVTVGAWVSRKNWTSCNGVLGSYSGIPDAGNLAPFSSPGPTRDGRRKPDLAAPGTAIGSTTSFDVGHACPGSPAISELLNDGMNHRMMQGTSMSAPHVTGAVALLLQKYGAMTPAQVTSYLQSHARLDGLTGPSPSNDWGNGKLDLGDLIDPAVRVLSPNGGEQVGQGGTLNLTWSATDSLGSVASVDLLLSRTGTGGPFATIALGVPNTGTYSWTVSSGVSNPQAAYLRVVAHDTNANVSADLSDAGFTIFGVLSSADPGNASFALSRVSPNPTRGGIQVEFVVARESRVHLSVQDVQGRTVAVIADGLHRAGRHTAVWEGLPAGAHASAGLYFVCYQTIEGRYAKRVVVVP